MTQPVKLTKYSHGGGCGCKISPRILDRILASQLHLPNSKNLLVGYRSKDDAAVYDIGNGEGIISTTDFFMPIVDDPEDFGRIAATNAISDIYAMAGTPIMAIAILGWPVDKLSPEIAQQVIDGGRIACADAHIPIAGGHSIDAPEPIFGLAVTGRVALEKLKQNNNAKPQDQLYLTKPLGVGILTTAEKKQCLLKEHRHIARDAMCTLNRIGQDLGSIKGVNAMTDITGFGLLGHLIELCEGSHLQATLEYKKLPLLPGVEHYQKLNCIPRGTQRNYDSYGYKASAISEIQKQILCDPQTSGGLLVSVSKQAESQFHAVALEYGLDLSNIGKLSVKHKECFVNII
ncbi:MAG: selenide, water dikinase SelD [Endozoicomonas sp. (ex Botrylloides leachii)]|nr:selenide, water dikinase SelD [Endozoicomonas sp. (ex Botrylloides leachii)]